MSSKPATHCASMACCHACRRPGKRIEQHARRAARARRCPSPSSVGSFAPYVAQAPRAARVAGHAVDELRGERRRRYRRGNSSARSPSLVSATCSTVVAAAAPVSTALVTGAAASQRAPRPRSRDPQQQKHRLGVMLVAEAHQSLDIVELDAAARPCGIHGSPSSQQPQPGEHLGVAQVAAAAGLAGCAGCASRSMQREPGIGLVPDLRRQLVPALEVLERMLAPRAARRSASPCAASRRRC